jgi:LysR family transcriptional regulator, benzoate and cis,cis-muconate-responsive activator of ben and cat genes
MELRHLRYFVSVAEKLSFRAAADNLHVSHPALSKQIRDLEYELGVKLLERSTVSVWLTSAGKTFYADAKDILARVEKARAAVKTASGNENLLVLATASPFWEAVMHSLLKRFTQRYPEIEIRMVEMKPWDQVAALGRGEFDMGFVNERDQKGHKSIESRLIIKSPLGVVLGADHPLASRKSLHCEDLAGEKFLALGSGRSSRHLNDIREVMPPKMFVGRRIKLVEGIESIFTMIASNQGISLLPQTFVESRKNSIAFIPLKDARRKIRFQLWAAWRRNNPSKTLQLLKDMLDETV